MARHLGVQQIIAVDANPGRLETAAELGATHTVDASDRGARDAIQQLTGDGADYIFDTTGHPDVVASALDSLAMTGTVVMAGSAPGRHPDQPQHERPAQRPGHPRDHPGRLGGTHARAAADRAVPAGTLPRRPAGERLPV